jgi:integrase
MNRPKDRQTAEGLLPRMEARPWADGKTVTYRYHPVGAPKPVNLGTDRIAACRKVLDMLGLGDKFGSLTWVWEKFTDDKHPAPRWRKLADGTRTDYRLAWKMIAKTFGTMAASGITAPMIARYVNIERASAPRRAVVEKSLMSNLFRYGITLGVCTANPTVGVEVPDSEPRTEAPAVPVLAGFLAWLERQTPQRRIIGMAAEYMSLSGSRRVEFLDLTWPQVDRVAGVVRTKRAKQRGKKRGEVIERLAITPKLADLLDRLQALNRDCLYVFPTRDNNAYSARGFKTLWQRCVLAAIDEKVITAADRFTFHDLRAYYVTEHKSEHGTLPDLHKNPGTTAAIYDRSKVVNRSAL